MMSSLFADLWIISDSPWFGEGKRAKTMYAKSAWFGPSRDNVIELDRLFGEPPLGTAVFAMVYNVNCSSLFAVFFWRRFENEPRLLHRSVINSAGRIYLQKMISSRLFLELA